MTDKPQDEVTSGLTGVHTRLLEGQVPIPPLATESFWVSTSKDLLPISDILSAFDSEFGRKTAEEEERSSKQLQSFRAIAPAPASARDGESFGALAGSKTALFSKSVARAGKAKAMPFSYLMAKEFYPNTLELMKGWEMPTMDDDPNAWRTTTEKKLQRIGGPKIIYSTTEGWSSDGHAEFGSVNIDGKMVKLDSYVLVRLADVGDDNEVLPAAGFAKVQRIFKDERGHGFAHVQWLIHGSSIFSKLASSTELFWENRCQDIPLSTICDNIKVSPHYSAATSSFHRIEAKYQQGEYFFRQSYERKSKAITELPSFLEELDSNPYISGRPCVCCDDAAIKSREEFALILDETGNHPHFKLKDVAYHEGNCVYLFDPNSKVFNIGQIKSISYKQNSIKQWIHPRAISLDVHLFARYDDLLPLYEAEPHGQRAQRDERRLYSLRRRMQFLATELEGRCTVHTVAEIGSRERLNVYKDESIHNFWISDIVSQESIGKEADLLTLADLAPSNVTARGSDWLSSHNSNASSMVSTSNGLTRKLQALSIFSGAGGLDAGLKDVVGHLVDFSHAVELDEAACHTLKLNNPSCTISCADASRMLERAKWRDSGVKLPPLFDRHGRVIPDLPYRGDVDVIFGGPCCQGFSTANRHPNPEDPRNPLTVTFLSYLEWYRPKWFLLENVTGFANHKLGAVKGSDGKLQGGLPEGMIKLVRRILTGLGYQTHHAMLQAAEYGVPSTRPRFILWASLPGHPLPSFPQPQHSAPQDRFGIMSTWYRTHNAAPHHSYTVGDAITDLPLWEWRLPAQAPPTTNDDTRDPNQPYFQSFEVVKGAKYTGPGLQHYASSPTNEFQRTMRKGMQIVFNHVTKCGVLDAERVCNIPRRFEADHMDLPEALMTDAMRDGKYDDVKERRYQRLHIDHSFQACTTRLIPNQKKQRCLHPFLHRIITVREYARAMSFPDSHVFDLEQISVEDAVRQIGNAVPYNFARVLGQGLLEAIVSTGKAKVIQRGYEQFQDFVPFDDFDTNQIEPPEMPGSKTRRRNASEFEEVGEAEAGVTKNKSPNKRRRINTKPQVHKTTTARKDKDTGMEEATSVRPKPPKSILSSEENTATDHKHSSQNSQMVIDLTTPEPTTGSDEPNEEMTIDHSYHHNPKTGFSIESSCESDDYEAIFTEPFDDEVLEEESDNSEDEIDLPPSKTQCNPS